MRPTAILAFIGLLTIAVAARAADPLPSWNDGPAKKAIVEFVGKVTREGSPDFVPSAERIATFDNDGTLWAEQPMYFQLIFALDRVKALAPQHPEWKNKEPFASLLKGDVSAALAGGDRSIVEIVMATHAGMTTAEFEKIVTDWIATAEHPRFKRPYTECVYQPMRELMAYLRANGFKTFIVSGGGVEFMRPWTERVYGIPPEQVVGSSIETKYEMHDGKPVLMRLAKVNIINDKTGKPVGINSHIGRRPIAAFGNSEGDRQMLEWTQAGGARLMMLVHHNDAAREYAYGPKSKIGTFSDALAAEANKNGWNVISMKDDWKTIFPFDTQAAAGGDYLKLLGKWVRPDGGYVIEMKNVAGDGALDAAYFNPRPIHVARAEASRGEAGLKVFVELRDANYPGSTYNLVYRPQDDRLEGIYYQALQRRSYEVVFERTR